MYTPFHVYTNYIFPFLAILGLLCLVEGFSHKDSPHKDSFGFVHILIFLYFPGILIQFKKEGAKKTRFWSPYRLADTEWLVSGNPTMLIFHIGQSRETHPFLYFTLVYHMYSSSSAWLRLLVTEAAALHSSCNDDI